MLATMEVSIMAPRGSYSPIVIHTVPGIKGKSVKVFLIGPRAFSTT